MEPIGLLMIEHRLIERAIEQIREKGKDCQEKSTCFTDLGQLIDFLSSYFDLCHHGKEEKILFAECGSKHLPTELKNLMHELIQEHITFRKMREKMTIFNQEINSAKLVKADKLNELIEVFCSTLKKHIEKEDNLFFPQSMKYFNGQEQKEMLDKFRDFDQGVMHEKYKHMISELESKDNLGGS
jgi:hemerythrin-like domain-containing protein